LIRLPEGANVTAVAGGGNRRPIRAVLFDFNGTISDDEPLLDRIYRELFAQLGLRLSTEAYYRELAGFSDPEIIERALKMNGTEPTPERRAGLLRAKVDRYKALAGQEPTVTDEVAAFVRAVAARVPVAIASGAVREEVEYVLARAGLHALFAAVVCVDDVRRGKPDPEGFVLALARLNDAARPSPPVRPAEALVIEDADTGVQAARAAGMPCVALRSPAYTGAPVAADEVVDALAPALVDRWL
jgi:beta-phosphoglucomutase